jgi:hypothetical protein
MSATSGLIGRQYTAHHGRDGDDDDDDDRHSYRTRPPSRASSILPPPDLGRFPTLSPTPAPRGYSPHRAAAGYAGGSLPWLRRAATAYRPLYDGAPAAPEPVHPHRFVAPDRTVVGPENGPAGFRAGLPSFGPGKGKGRAGGGVAGSDGELDEGEVMEMGGF